MPAVAVINLILGVIDVVILDDDLSLHHGRSHVDFARLRAFPHGKRIR